MAMGANRVSTANFAGRIGGNQEFIADPADEDTHSLLRKQPDAAPLRSISASLDLKSFRDRDLWRMTVLEGVGTGLLIYLLSAASNGLSSLPNLSPYSITLYAALVNWLGLSIFTYCLGPVSGAHLNPSITLATFFAGLSTFPRTVLYVAAQTIGGIVAGYWLRLSTGGDAYFSSGIIPGCTVDPSRVSVGQLFALEFVFVLIGLFMAFGVGLDPRQGKIYGAAYGPVLVGITFALITLCSGIMRVGYTAASFNPARCLGLMLAKNDLQYHWVHWVAPLTATMLNGFVYHVAPPWQKEKSMLRDASELLGHALHKEA